MNSGTQSVGIVTMPTITPAAGDYSASFIEVSITADDGKEIYYTTDGTTPTEQSSRYVGSFTIIGSKTVSAISVSNGNSSAVVKAAYNLNAGKLSSQMGAVKGVVSLYNRISAEAAEQMANDDIYITSPELPGVVQKTKIGQSFRMEGMDAAKMYSLYFSNQTPGNAISRSASLQLDIFGKPIVSLKLDVQPAEGDGVDVGEVALKPTGTITGTAKKYAEDGTEESDHAGITVFIPGTSFAAYTDKNGAFSMTGVPQGLHTIRAMYAGYTFSEKENINLDATNDSEPKTTISEVFDIYYAKGTLKGSVILSDSESGYGGINVVISEATGKYSSTAVTQANGGWLINDVTPGTYSIEIHKDGYVDQTINDVIVTGAKITSVARVVLQEDGGSITGSVSVAATTDLSGISILAEKVDNDTQNKVYYALTNANGEFTFGAVTVGIYKVTATYPGYRSAVRDNVVVSLGQTSNAGSFSISEKATYSVTGFCVLAGMGSGFEGTNVLMQSSTGATKSTTTNIDGGWTISDVDAGSYVLTFSRNGFVTNNSVSVEVGTRTITIVENVVLQSSVGTVSGNVTLESADTNEGIAILIYKEDNNTVSYNTITDSRGHYAIAGITPGYYRVQATKNGYNTGISDPITVSSGVTTTPSDMLLSISLRALYGTVTLEGRTDYTGVRITATKTTSTKEIYSALSNKDGFYALSGMTPGEYILSFSFEGYRSYTSPSISLSSDSSLNLDAVELNKATGNISGIVNLEGCTDHSGIKVSIVGTDYSFITEANGEYQFTVPSGNYPGGVRFEKADYQLTAKAETIPVLTDSTYGVLTVEMKATANTIKGIIDLAGSEDDSGIAVTIDEYSDVETAISLQDGSWTLYHVPVDTERFVTLRFKRENTPDVTKQIKVIANDFVDVGTLEMIPNAASLTGHAFLTGKTEHSGILVTVTTDGKDDITVRTTSDGKFYVSNILSTGSHNVTFIKDGWNSQTIVISDFEPLEVRDIDEAQNISLVDTTAPVLSSVVIEDGANTTNSAALSIKINAAESGSGISKMAVQIKAPEYDSLYPSVLDWQDYKITFTKDLSELPKAVYTGNGEYIVYITLKDAAGNVSETVNDKIVVTDQVSILKGVLTGSDLILTKAKSPYRVESNILVEEGSVLTIEPGTQIEFAGDYYLKVNGEINAIGTKEDKILFTGVNDNINWQLKISELSVVLQTENTYTYIDGCILKYVVVKKGGVSDGGSNSSGMFIDSCEFDNLSIGDRTIVMNSTINGGISSETWSYGNYIINNIISNGVYMWGTGKETKLINNIIRDSRVRLEWYPCCTIENNIFENSYFDIYLSSDSEINIYNNNFVNSPKNLINASETYYNNQNMIDFINNYWGEVNTEELNLIGENANASFIYDYYDDFELSKIDYSNWATEPIENCGYLGDDFWDSFISFDYTINGYDFERNGGYPNSNSAELSIVVNPQYHLNNIAYVRISQSLTGLKSADWTAYSANQAWTLDTDSLADGMATIYVQLKDSEGNISSPVMHEVYYSGE